jgi:hypothetical protein
LSKHEHSFQAACRARNFSAESVRLRQKLRIKIALMPASLQAKFGQVWNGGQERKKIALRTPGESLREIV